MLWHILTGEYEPTPGGVSDYTALVARGLARAGDQVHVWTPSPGADGSDADGVVAHRLPDHFGPRALAALSSHLRADTAPRRVLVQYVPQAFGWKGSNLGVCLWLRAQRRESIWVMFHEVAQPIGWTHTWLHNGLGLVTHGMAAIVAGSAERIFVSTPAWTPRLRTLCHRDTPIGWLPVPSVIPPIAPRCGRVSAEVGVIRERFAGGRPLVGHFGTFGSLMTPCLFGTLACLAQNTGARFVLFGRGSDVAARRAVERFPVLERRVHGAGALPSAEVSHYLSACDVLLQPYPDGVTSRRTSVMAALAHGRPVVTSAGPLTEPLWHQSAGVCLAPAGDAVALAAAVSAVLDDPNQSVRLAREALAIYDTHFHIRHTIAALRASHLSACGAPPA